MHYCVDTGDDGAPRTATGGAPMRPGGKIYLCGRNDGNGDRHFHGEIAHLAFYDVALSEDEVGEDSSLFIDNSHICTIFVTTRLWAIFYKTLRLLHCLKMSNNYRMWLEMENVHAGSILLLKSSVGCHGFHFYRLLSNLKHCIQSAGGHLV